MTLIPGITNDVFIKHIFPFTAEQIRCCSRELNELYLNKFKLSYLLQEAAKKYPLVVASCAHVATMRIIEMLIADNNNSGIISVFRLIVRTRDTIALYKLYTLYKPNILQLLTDSVAILETIGINDLFTQTYMWMYGVQSGISGKTSPVDLTTSELMRLILRTVNNHIKDGFTEYRNDVVTRYAIRLIKNGDKRAKQFVAGLRDKYFTAILGIRIYAVKTNNVDIVCMLIKKYRWLDDPVTYACLIKHNKIKLIIQQQHLRQHMLYVALLMNRIDIIHTVKRINYETELCDVLLNSVNTTNKYHQERWICSMIMSHSNSNSLRRLLVYLNRSDLLEYSAQIASCGVKLCRDDVDDVGSEIVTKAVKLGLCNSHLRVKHLAATNTEIRYDDIVDTRRIADIFIQTTLGLLLKYRTMDEYILYRSQVNPTIPMLHRFHERRIALQLARRGYLKEHFNDIQGYQYNQVFVEAVVSGNHAARRIMAQKIINWDASKWQGYELHNTNRRDIERIFV
ncbi:hypothetical protein E24_00173 [Faustovirus]|nr:hypothetical protein PRJ_Fausto_00159 [Faustovirus]AMN83104.1 hypothetical protein E24_00173 [Faustovirus]AMN84086.1 hypothetical protein D5a_00172 [Faustovirus]AMN85073.1 hypothetical protein E23_00172 [Faustovirus]QBR99072.1 hypothetical protein [Faustovirus mariensis]